MAFKVTPWEVSGKIDYEKLMKEFGLKEFEPLPKKLQDFIYFRRGIIYAQRDFGLIVDAIEKKKPFVMMTGLMPSGRFHFGHKILADQIVFYQKLGAKIYLAVADVEAYNSRNPNMKELRDTAIKEYLTNYVALGLDLKKCDFYFQSKRSKDGKKSNAFYSLANMFARHSTFNEFKAVYGELSPAKIASSLLQAADMYHPQLPEFEGGPVPTVIPVGADQDPHIRLARGMAQRMKLYDFLPIATTAHMFMQGLKGGKMSSSDENSYIALTDSPKVAAEKINKYAFSGGQATVEEHRKKGGNPDIDVPYQMLFFGLEPNDNKLKKIYEDYRSGKLLTGELKQILIERITQFLKEHQEKRKKAEKFVEEYVKEQGI